MHQVSYNIMVNLLMKYPHTAGRVLDVGSYNVSGTYKPMFGSGYKYEGLDIAAGPNVDIVTTDPYKWPIEDNIYGVLLSLLTKMRSQLLYLIVI